MGAWLSCYQLFVSVAVISTTTSEKPDNTNSYFLLVIRNPPCASALKLSAQAWRGGNSVSNGIISDRIIIILPRNGQKSKKKTVSSWRWMYWMLKIQYCNEGNYFCRALILVPHWDQLISLHIIWDLFSLLHVQFIFYQPQFATFTGCFPIHLYPGSSFSCSDWFQQYHVIVIDVLFLDYHCCSHCLRLSMLCTWKGTDIPKQSH